jgi:hypothetical protein
VQVLDVPKTKVFLEGSHFESFKDIQNNVRTILKGRPENDFQQCFQARQIVGMRIYSQKVTHLLLKVTSNISIYKVSLVM